MSGAQVTPFGTAPDGTEVQLIRLSGGGLTAQVLTYGATVQDLRLDGIDHPLVLGAETLDPYPRDMLYFGAIVGRFSNRIGQGRFSIDGESFQASQNFLGRHTLHGGTLGSGQVVWDILDLAADRATLGLTLPDGHMGFPGDVTVRADIALDDGALAFDIRSETTAPTPCSFAHHGYFNLDGAGDITGHALQVAADSYLPVDAEMIPTGEVRDVTGTPFDFRVSQRIGRRGLDHNLCLSDTRVPLQRVARLTGTSGIGMEIVTTEPGLQVYDGAYIPETGLPGLGGRRYGPHGGIALETQAWPDAPNQPGFPDAILRPGEILHQQTRYRFFRPTETDT